MARRYHVARHDRRPDRRGRIMYAQSVDAIGADWNSARVPLTRAQVAQIVDVCDTADLDIRDYETFEPIGVETVQGYIGQDVDDCALYDAARAWRSSLEE